MTSAGGRGRFVLLTTTSGASDQEVAYCRRMIAGLRAQEADGVAVLSVLLVQQDAAITAEFIEAIEPPSYMHVISAGARMPLSDARNRMLEICEREKLIGANDILAYPDDDSWYPPQLLKRIQNLFEKNPFCDFFFCCYGSEPLEAELGQLISNPSSAAVVTHASSNTIFVRGRIANEIGGFDPELGVGTKNKSGEDLDYAIRAHFAADQSAFSPLKLVGHRDKDPAIRAKYYRGSLIVLGRYALLSGGMLWLFLRKLAIGAVFGVLLRLSPGELFSAIGAALWSFGRGKSARGKLA